MLYKIFAQLHPLMMQEHPNPSVRGAVESVLHSAKHHIDDLVPHDDRYDGHDAISAFGHGHDARHSTISINRDSVLAESRDIRRSASGRTLVRSNSTVSNDEAADVPRYSSAVSSNVRNKSVGPIKAWLFSCCGRGRDKVKQRQQADEDEAKERVRGTLDICECMEAARQKYQNIAPQDINTLDFPSLPFAEYEDEMELFIREQNYEVALVKSVNTSFLNLVANEYWEQLERGEFIAGNADAEMLLTSISLAQRNAGSHLSDLTHLIHRLAVSHEDTGADQDALREVLDEEERLEVKNSKSVRRARVNGSIESKSLSNNAIITSAMRNLPDVLGKRDKNAPPTPLLRFIDSAAFNVSMSAILILNAIFIFIEQTKRDTENYHHKAWLWCEIAFTGIFIAEFMVKLVALRCAYFCDSWNLFDFIILDLSLVSLVMEFLASGPDQDVSNEARIFRLNRLFRVLRILRLFRLFKFFLILRTKFTKEDISLQLAEHLRTITACRAFIKAHVASQLRMAELFGHAGKFTSAEEVRCILESQTEIYRAIAVAVKEASEIETSTLVAMRLLRDSIGITNKLSTFVYSAHEAGVITAREADTLAHPLQDHVRLLHTQISQAIQSGQTGALERTHRQSVAQVKTKSGHLVAGGDDDDLPMGHQVSLMSMASRFSDGDESPKLRVESEGGQSPKLRVESEDGINDGI